MFSDYKIISELLKSHDIKPSVQRITIYSYLRENPVHPTVDHIYNALLKQIPTLSRTTVYNTLNMFVEKQLAVLVSVDGNEARYDADVLPHLHFKCVTCQAIYDIQLNSDFSFEKFVPDCQILEKQIYCKGICQKCLKEKS